MKLKKTFLLLALALIGTWAAAQEKIDYAPYEDKCNFYIANDLGRNGYYDQKPIAELMGVMHRRGRHPPLRGRHLRQRPPVDDQLRTDLRPPRTDDRLVSHLRQPRVPRLYAGRHRL